MARMPVDPPFKTTPHGAFGYERKSKADGACGRLNTYPCTHLGVDLAGDVGQAVYAPEDGRVVIAAYDDVTPPLRGYGPGAIVFLGRSGYRHILGHLDPEWWRALRPQVPSGPFDGVIGRPRMPTEGREYKEGDQLGVMSSARHVHWEVSTKGKRYDPVAWLQGKLVTTGGGQSGLLLLLLLLMMSGRRKRR